LSLVTMVVRHVFTLICNFEDSRLVRVLEKPAVFVLQLNDLSLFKVHRSSIRNIFLYGLIVWWYTAIPDLLPFT